VEILFLTLLGAPRGREPRGARAAFNLQYETKETLVRDIKKKQCQSSGMYYRRLMYWNGIRYKMQDLELTRQILTGRQLLTIKS